MTSRTSGAEVGATSTNLVSTGAPSTGFGSSMLGGAPTDVALAGLLVGECPPFDPDAT